MVNRILSDNFIKPNSDYNFANLPSLFFNLLINQHTKMPNDVLSNNDKPDKIIFLLLDGFGWNLLKANRSISSVKNFFKDGKLTKINSQFPSTTTAQVTTINIIKSVTEHGLYEWNCYDPDVDEIISPIPFTLTGSKENELLKNTNIMPEKLFSKNTIYTYLKKYKINSYVMQNIEFSNSTYNKQMFKGSELITYKTTTEGLIKLSDKINSVAGKAYFYFYFSGIDSMGHAYGPNSPFVKSEIDSFFMLLNKFFSKRIKSKNTLLILTADHGMASMNPLTTIYLDKKIPKIAAFIKRNKKNKLLVPAGSPRDMFLHIKKEKVDAAQKMLRKELKNKAEVVKTKDLISQRYFGSKISHEFLKRVGNLIILPYNGESVWWYGDGVYEQKYLGHHGGLTSLEIEIPLFIKNL
jgi:predicted AlkP superfamily pyrophosphatase or phosphodiesterase